MNSLPQANILYRTSNGPCPYLTEGHWVTDVFYAAHVADSFYENLLENGWRRSGCCFYRNCCPGCTGCIPIRIDIRHFRPDRAQKRALKRNQAVTVERVPAGFHACDYELYRNYCTARHGQNPSEEDYIGFLVESPLTTEIMRYREGAHLIAVAWIDVLPHGISSVYCAYDPACAQRSPGTLSILRQIELCRRLGKPWLYLGFYVPGSPRMGYKIRFRPSQLYLNGCWCAPEGPARQGT